MATLHPTREQLASAIAALSSQAIRAKLENHELTALATEVARAELERRDQGTADAAGHAPGAAIEAATDAERTSAEFDGARDAALEFLQRPLGWSWGQWIAATAVGAVVVALFGTTARNAADQSFLHAVIAGQALVLAAILRALSAILSSSSALGVLAKLVAVAALCVVLGALSLCSIMAQKGWGGG